MKNRSLQAAFWLSLSIFTLIIVPLFMPENISMLAFGQDAGAAVPTFAETLSKMMPVILVSFFIFYFMVIRPQNEKLKSQKVFLAALAKGDTVVTTGGIIAKVALVEPEVITLEISPQVRLRVETEHVKRKIETKKSEEK